LIRRAPAIFVLGLAATTLAAAPAHGAATRAEYVAEVDQVCTGFTPQFQTLHPAFKKLEASLNSVPTESDEHERRRLNRAYRLLGRYVGKQARIFGAMAEQVALVTPAVGDEAAVGQWIEGLRQFATLQAQSAPAFKRRKFGRAGALSGQSLEALNNGGAAVASFGIGVCPTHIDVPETTYSDAGRG
jgi:hypothetical protein